MSVQMDTAAANLAANLRLVASYYPSVAEVARKLGINRQQFVKYLSGTSFPARSTLRRICDFMSVDEFEILMPHDQFRNLIQLRRTTGLDGIEIPPSLRAMLLQAASSPAEVRRLHGYYYEYRLSYTRMGLLLRSFTYIYPWRSYTFYRRIERLQTPRSRGGPPEVFKYDGVIIPVGDRLHLLDQETITRSELTHTVLYGSYANRVSRLVGLNMGVSARSSHEPIAARICLEYIGRSVSRSQALRQCGLLALDAPEVSEFVRDYLARPDSALPQIIAPPV